MIAAVSKKGGKEKERVRCRGRGVNDKTRDHFGRTKVDARLNGLSFAIFSLITFLASRFYNSTRAKEKEGEIRENVLPVLIK